MTSSNEWKLPTNVRPTLYTLTLEPDLDNFTFTGSETIAIEVDESTSSVKMNSSEIAVQSANTHAARRLRGQSRIHLLRRRKRDGVL